MFITPKVPPPVPGSKLPAPRELRMDEKLALLERTFGRVEKVSNDQFEAPKVNTNIMDKAPEAASGSVTVSKSFMVIGEANEQGPHASKTQRGATVAGAGRGTKDES